MNAPAATPAHCAHRVVSVPPPPWPVPPPLPPPAPTSRLVKSVTCPAPPRSQVPSRRTEPAHLGSRLLSQPNTTVALPLASRLRLAALPEPVKAPAAAVRLTVPVPALPFS